MSETLTLTSEASNVALSSEEFIVKQLKENSKDRLFLLKTEKEMTSLIAKKQGPDSFKFPPMNPFYRMLIHRVAELFGLGHSLDENKQSVVVFKTENSKM